MTEHTYHITIASVGETLYTGEVLSATFPGMSGVFTVLAHHEPLVAVLKDGEVTVKTVDGDTRSFPIQTGILECSHNHVAVLL